LAETLSAFLTRLRLAADTLDILERQRIVRLVVKEVLVGDDTIVIRHSIPVPSGPPGGSSPPPSGGSDDVGVDRSYLLRTGRDHSALRNALLARRFQNQSEEPQHRVVAHPPSHFRQHDLTPQEESARPVPLDFAKRIPRAAGPLGEDRVPAQPREDGQMRPSVRL